MMKLQDDYGNVKPLCDNLRKTVNDLLLSSWYKLNMSFKSAMTGSEKGSMFGLVAFASADFDSVPGIVNHK